MWALVTIKGGVAVGEDVGKSVNTQEWGAEVRLTLSISTPDTTVQCDWPETQQNMKRQEFCAKYEGYGSLCHCAKPLPLSYSPLPLVPNNVASVPVTVIASNRPLYLFQMLRRLLSVPGADPSMVTVFVDGFFQEPMDVAKLLGVRAVQVRRGSEGSGQYR